MAKKKTYRQEMKELFWDLRECIQSLDPRLVPLYYTVIFVMVGVVVFIYGWATYLFLMYIFNLSELGQIGLGVIGISAIYLYKAST